MKLSTILLMVVSTVLFSSCKKDCKECDGIGYTMEQCEECEGTGRDYCLSCMGRGLKECDDCDGRGYVMCSSCYGDGSVRCSMCFGKGMTIAIRATVLAALNVTNAMDMVKSKNNVLSAKVMEKLNAPVMIAMAQEKLAYLSKNINWTK